MVWNKIKTYGELVMFSHTLFSLPFAIIALIWAADGIPSIHVIFWSLVALAGGRNGANAINRLIDAKIDAKNPRTATRHMPQGIVKKIEVIILTTVCFVIFFVGAAMLNPLCLKLAPLAIILFMAYSYTKRFTWACHVILGITCGGAPVGAWIATTGTIEWPAIVLGAVVTFWVAGFDIIYAVQDIDFDRKEGLYSMPARFGAEGALLISSAFHTITISLLLYMSYLLELGGVYIAGVLCAAVLLVWEHKIVSPTNLTHVKIASYNINQVVSVLLLCFVLVEQFAF